MGRDYNEKVDVWSAGVILYIMLAGVPPFYGDGPAETFEAVLRGNLRFPTKIFRSVSPEAKDLLRKMICRDVSRRLSAEQVLSKYYLSTFRKLDCDSHYSSPCAIIPLILILAISDVNFDG